MGMSGKTFLSAFQMGARMYPDIVKDRADEVDRKAKRKVINLQKKKLKEDRDLAEKLKEREFEGMKSLNDFKIGYEALDMNDPRFPSNYAKLVKDNITGIGMSERSRDGYNFIDEMVKKNARYKSQVESQNKAWVALDWYNERNPLAPIDPETAAPDALMAVNNSYKDYLQEEKNKATRADVEARSEAETDLKDKAAFTAFIEETGSAFNPEDFSKPEAKTALRIHKQTEEVKKLIMTVGEDGLPIMAKLRIKPDGSGYENHLAVLAELTTLSNKQKTDRGIKGKSLSEQQGNALMYSERLKFANETMDRKVLEGVAPGQDILNNLLSEATGTKTFSFFNAVIDPKFQVWKSAADNFIRATLRKESGAAIADHEYIGGFKDYIPLMGDSKELVGHKRTLRKGISDTMRRVSSVPWDESYLPSQPLRFQSREQAERFLRKGGWLEEGTKAEYKDGGKIIPFTVTDKRKKKPANKAVPKLGSEALADPRTNPLLKGAVNPTSIRP
tara:strand:+ start:360 stop:1868 length:1509 start_codon:yes stop_codon:yes gene_type:complete